MSAEARLLAELRAAAVAVGGAAHPRGLEHFLAEGAVPPVGEGQGDGWGLVVEGSVRGLVVVGSVAPGDVTGRVGAGFSATTGCPGEACAGTASWFGRVGRGGGWILPSLRSSWRIVRRRRGRALRTDGAAGGKGVVAGGVGCVSPAGTRGAGSRRTAGSCRICSTTVLARVGTANPATAPQNTRAASDL